MNGTDYLLDTNVVLGCLGAHGRIAAFIEREEAAGASFAVSVITRMELLSFPSITAAEEAAIQEFLSRLDVVPITDGIERRTIAIRRRTRAKLPDAIILATAFDAGRSLLTCDEDLLRLTVPGLSIRDPSV